MVSAELGLAQVYKGGSQRCIWRSESERIRAAVIGLPRPIIMHAEPSLDSSRVVGSPTAAEMCLISISSNLVSDCDFPPRMAQYCEP